MAILKVSLVQGSRGEINSVGLFPLLGYRIPPSSQRANASGRYCRRRRDIRCLWLLVSHRLRRR